MKFEIKEIDGVPETGSPDRTRTGIGLICYFTVLKYTIYGQVQKNGPKA